MSLTAEAESRRPTHRYAFVNEAGEGTPTPARPEPARGVPSESALSGARLFDQHRDGGPAAVSGAAGGAIGGGRAGRDDPAAAACVPPPALSVLSQLPRAASGVDALDDIVEMRAQMARLHAALDQTLSQQRLLRAAPAPDSASRAAAASGGWAGGVGGGFEGAPATPTPHSNGVGGHFPGPASSPSASQAGAGVWSGVGVGEAFGADGAGAFARALSALAAAHQQQQQHVGSQLYQGDASAPPPYPASHALCSAHQAPASSAAAASASASAAGAALASAASEGVEAVVAVSVAPPPPLILLHDDVDVDVAAVRGSVAKGPLAASPASPPLNPDSPISKALIRVGALWRFLRRLTSRVVSLLAGPQAAEKLEQGDPRVVFRLGVVVLALLSAVSYATGKGSVPRRHPRSALPGMYCFPGSTLLSHSRPSHRSLLPFLRPLVPGPAACASSLRWWPWHCLSTRRSNSSARPHPRPSRCPHPLWSPPARLRLRPSTLGWRGTCSHTGPRSPGCRQRRSCVPGRRRRFPDICRPSWHSWCGLGTRRGSPPLPPGCVEWRRSGAGARATSTATSPGPGRRHASSAGTYSPSCRGRASLGRVPRPGRRLGRRCLQG